MDCVNVIIDYPSILLTCIAEFIKLCKKDEMEKVEWRMEW